jgi:hypothetical protein
MGEKMNIEIARFGIGLYWYLRAVYALDLDRFWSRRIGGFNYAIHFPPDFRFQFRAPFPRKRDTTVFATATAPFPNVTEVTPVYVELID